MSWHQWAVAKWWSRKQTLRPLVVHNAQQNNWKIAPTTVLNRFETASYLDCKKATISVGLEIGNWSYISTDLVLLVLGRTMLFNKSPRIRHFKSDWDEIWQDCTSSKYALIDGVRFLRRRNTFKTQPRRPSCHLLLHMHLTSLARCMHYSLWSIIHS